LSQKTVELLVGQHRLTLTGAHETYLDDIAGSQQWGETPLMHLVKELPQGATFIDAGANIGLTAITAAIARPDLRIIAFEPVPSNADLLAQNVQANMIKNCKVVPSAVGDATTSLTMSDNGPWSVVHTGDTGPLHVPVTTLDAYCREHLPNTKIDLIKIDVEGYEPSALAGAQNTISRWAPVIFMEFNSWALILGGRNPLGFAQSLWEAFSVESASGVAASDPVVFVHDNMVRHGCVEDIILHLRSPSALSLIATSEDHVTDIALRSKDTALRSKVDALQREIDGLRRSTSWRLTAPLRFAKSLLMR
jgi:FkbM family methyltransferase